MEYAELDWQEAVILGCAKQEGILEAIAGKSSSAGEVAKELGASSRAVYACSQRSPSSGFLRRMKIRSDCSTSTEVLFWIVFIQTTLEVWSCTASS
jgi:hypothetical protein